MYWASAPAVSGRLTIPIRRATPCAVPAGDNKIVTLPTAHPPEAPARPVTAEPPAPAGDRWKDIAETGSAVAAGLDAIAAADTGFDAKHFITGARAAYEMIVTSFCRRRSPPVQNLLSREVFDGFDAAITERESRGETAETRFVSIDASTITAAELRNRTAQITVRFVSKLVSSTRDRNGAVVDGNADKVTDVTDVWTFARDVSSRDPNWKVVATEAGQYADGSALPGVFIVRAAHRFRGDTHAARSAETDTIRFPDTQYEPVEWSDLDGWASDDHAAAFSTFLASCKALTVTKQRPAGRGSLQSSMRSRTFASRAFAAIPLDDDGARKFFEDNFRPLRINRIGDNGGFLTGYYEPIIEGSRVPTGEFTAPLYRRPPNLVVSGRRKLGDAFPSKGVKVGRRFGRRKIVPYYDRGQIEDGALDGWHLEICCLHSPVDVLFAQIQGSARIRLEDGTILRVNYDFHNGWPYTPVGRVLIDRGYLSKDAVSMQSIRDWMEANPDLAKDVRRANKSYVFFRITDLATEDEAIGAEGVPLVPGRSIAVDHALHVYGTPFFIDANLPIANEKTGDAISPADVCARHRFGNCRPGARRYLFRRRRRGCADRRPHQESRRLHDAHSA